MINSLKIFNIIFNYYMENNFDNTVSKENLKILFIYNAIQDGWCVKKEDNMYLFRKKHENKKKYFSEDYLKKFVLKYNNLDIQYIN